MPSISFAFNKCLIYALEYVLHTLHEHVSSIGVISFSYCALNKLSLPLFVYTCPWRPFLDGYTQSKKSIPLSTASNILAGVPTPIRYVGLSSGRYGTTLSMIRYISSCDSPTARP